MHCVFRVLHCAIDGSYPGHYPVYPGNAQMSLTHVAGWAKNLQNNEEPAAPWGWLRSAYSFLCLFYAKCSRWFRNSIGRLSQKLKSFTPITHFERIATSVFVLSANDSAALLNPSQPSDREFSVNLENFISAVAVPGACGAKNTVGACGANRTLSTL